jgi:transcriptional regulator with XRE-family HTH domain
MATLKAQVGDLIRRHRKRLGWTQDELAERTGRSVEMINRMERGQAAPSFDTLEALSRELGVPVRDLFGAGGHAAAAGRDDPLVRLIARVSMLDEADLDWVDRLVAVALNRKVRGRAQAN